MPCLNGMGLQTWHSFFVHDYRWLFFHDCRASCVIHLHSFTVYRDIDIHPCACTTSQRTMHTTENVVTSCATFHNVPCMPLHGFRSSSANSQRPIYHVSNCRTSCTISTTISPTSHTRTSCTYSRISQTARASGAFNSTCQPQSSWQPPGRSGGVRRREGRAHAEEAEAGLR